MKKIIIVILSFTFLVSMLYADANEDLLAGTQTGNLEKVKTALRIDAYMMQRIILVQLL